MDAKISLKHPYISTRQHGDISKKTGCELYCHRRDNLNLTQDIIFWDVMLWGLVVRSQVRHVSTKLPGVVRQYAAVLRQ